MTEKNRYRPSQTVEALFMAAAMKIKTAAEKAIANQDAMKTESVSAKDEVETKINEPSLEQEMEAHTEASAADELSEIAAEIESVGQTYSGLCAEDIMNKDLIWASPNDPVQEFMQKMRQQEVHCVLIGQNGVLEGLVSDTDLAAAISPYLRPEFSHMREPKDDATLQIEAKWIMSRPVYTVSEKASLSDIIGVMQRVGQSNMPVIDDQGMVCGLVTESELMGVILKIQGNSN